MAKRSLPDPAERNSLKKTRIWIAILISASFLFSFLFMAVSRFRKNQFVFTLPVSFFTNIKREARIPDIFPPPKKEKKSAKKMEKIVMDILGNEKENWGIWVEDLKGNFVWQYRADQPFPAASLIKLPVAARFYQEAETGRFSLGEKWKLTKGDKVKGNGRLQFQPPGTILGFEKLIFLSLNRSDNTAFHIIVEKMGENDASAAPARMGMKQTSFADDLTTPADVALFFRRLYQGDLLSKKNNQAFINALKKTSFDDQIVAGVPEGITVAHKVGAESGFNGDAGIVFVPHRPLLLVFLSKNISSASAKTTISRLTREIYWYLVD